MRARSYPLVGVATALALTFAATAVGTAHAAEPPKPAPAPASPATDDDVEVPASPQPAPPGSPTAAPPVNVAPVGVVPVAPSPLVPEIPSPPGATTSPAPTDASREIQALRARVDALEAKAAAEPAHAIVRSDPPQPPQPPTTSFDASAYSRSYPRGLVLSGYVQAQYQQNQSSQDQLDANGTTLNQNRFLVRRARLRIDRGWEYAFATIEVDGNNVNGLAFGLRRAEASVLLRAKDAGAPPLAILTAGLTSVPFGYELYEPNRTRLFLERTTGSRAFFPGDPDFGATLSGGIGFLRYSLGAFNGTPVPDSQPSAIGFDPTSEKDFLARFGAETEPMKDLGVSGGVSFIGGSGLHAGTAATKATLQWQDTNQNGTVDPGEVIGVPGQAATPSKTFPRWAVGVDLQARLKTPIGRGLVYGEAYVGSNYDRGLFVADPVSTGANLREVGWYVAYVQEVTRYGIIGLRVDQYNPNADATTQRAGSLLPFDQSITTWSPLVGLVLPDRARLVFEYDHIDNHQGIDARGVPIDLPEDQWALRLQVEM